MRIIAGAWRGRTLEAPASLTTRPTSDRAREGLFSMLTSRIGSFEELRVLDLFAGTGALGLEALSRGAAHCTFVERDAGAIEILRRNVGGLGATAASEMRAQGVEHLAPPARPFDVAFLDPPYNSGLAQRAVDHLAAPGFVAAGGWVSVETEQEDLIVPDTFELDADRLFGKALIRLLRRAV